VIWVFEHVIVAESCSIQYTGQAYTHPTYPAFLKYHPSVEIQKLDCVAGWASQVAKIIFSKFYIAIYNLLNIERVISKAEVRESREAGTIHRWFTGVAIELGLLA